MPDNLLVTVRGICHSQVSDLTCPETGLGIEAWCMGCRYNALLDRCATAEAEAARLREALTVDALVAAFAREDEYLRVSGHFVTLDGHWDFAKVVAALKGTP